jgi:hypothetical protein
MHGEKAISYRVLVWKPEGKRAFGRPMHRLKNKNFTLHIFPVTSSLIYQSKVNSKPSNLRMTQTIVKQPYKTLAIITVF